MSHITIKNEDLSTLKSQHEYIDKNLRSTSNKDYVKIQGEANRLFNLRELLESQNRLQHFDELGKRMFPDFYQQFPHFFKSIKDVESSRVDEMKNVMYMMFENLQKVQAGKLSHTEMREKVFEEDLAYRYMKN